MNQKPSPNNPCPFLRALVVCGVIKERAEKITDVTSVISEAGGEEEGKLSKAMLFIIALIANGFSPLRLLKSLFVGLDIEFLRAGPLYKKGVSSRIINPDGSINDDEFKRMESYGEMVVDPESKRSELGLKLIHLNKMMDDNFERANESRRNIDRRLMDGEWPVLLKVMGKDKGEKRYLSVKELTELFYENRFPDRISKKLQLKPIGST